MSADPVQLLERLSPPEGWSEPTDLDADPVAAAILERVFADEDTNVVSLDSERRRRRRGIGGAVVIAALVAGGAVAAILNRNTDETFRVACWSEAASPPTQVVGLEWDGRTNPVALCAEMWSTGSFTEVDEPPPDLETCVTDDDSAAVIPGGSEVCGRLGFAPYSGTPDELALTINELQELFDQEFNAKTCVTSETAERETAQLLDEYGLSGWTPKIVGTFSADEPCATVSFGDGLIVSIAPLAPEN